METLFNGRVSEIVSVHDVVVRIFCGIPRGMRRHLLLISDALEVSFQTTTKSLRRFAGVSFGRVTSLGVSTTIFKRVRLNGFEIAEQLTLDVSERC